MADGSVRHLSLSVGQVTEAFKRAGDHDAAERPEADDAATPFIDLYVAPVSVPAIGKRLLGDSRFAELEHSLKPGQQAILVAANGAYSYKGSGYVRGGLFDRFAVLQGDNSIRFHDTGHMRLGDVHAGDAPTFRDVDVFSTPEGTTLDVTQPWRLQLLAQRAFGARAKSFLTFDLSYQLPQAYLKPAPAPAAPAHSTAPAGTPTPVSSTATSDASEAPIWVEMWRAKTGQIVVLLCAIGLLTLIFFFQDFLVRRPVLYDRVRLAFLAFTLAWIG